MEVIIRRLIYTTNPIEGFHRQVRKFTKTKGAFTSENALLKLVYCACQKIAEKWTTFVPNWALTILQLDVYFEGRLKLQINEPLTQLVEYSACVAKVSRSKLPTK